MLIKTCTQADFAFFRLLLQSVPVLRQNTPTLCHDRRRYAEDPTRNLPTNQYVH
jgi:hypothetical protein